MGRKVDPSRYGSSAPKLTQEDLEEDAAILTVAEFDEAELEDDEGKRVAAFVTFEETGERRLWLNKGMLETLVEQLGDDADKWIGQKVPVEKHTAMYNKREYPKVRVMQSEEWEQAFKDAGVKRAGQASARPSATKRR
jgi:hypothetical protein